MFVVIGVLIAVPFVRLVFNILRPDADKPATLARRALRAPEDVSVGTTHSAALAEAEIARAVRIGEILTQEPSDSPTPPDIAAGRAFDATLTAEFLTRFRAAVEKADSTPPSPATESPDTAAYDGALRAECAAARAARDAAGLNRAARLRLRLAGALRTCAASPAALMEALEHERSVFAEIRADAALLVADTAELKPTLDALARHALAPDEATASHQAAAFDASLERAPDAGLAAMRANASAFASRTPFLRLALAGRRPNAHREKVSALLADFGAAMAKPAFPAACRAFAQPGTFRDARLASLLLRERALGLARADAATPYFFRQAPATDSSMEAFVLKFTALASSDDIFGEALLLRRHAELTALLARRDRTRFDAAATAYALALESRRDAAGNLPRDIGGLFEGLCDTFPSDPFTDDAVIYSRKRMTLHSPGADAVNLGGLEDAEFASENAQLWEPTVTLEPERPTNPAAFGLRPSDLDKPVRKPWEFPSQ